MYKKRKEYTLDVWLQSTLQVGFLVKNVKLVCLKMSCYRTFGESNQGLPCQNVKMIKSQLIPITLIFENVPMWPIKAVIFSIGFLFIWNKDHKPGALTDESRHGRLWAAFYLESDMCLLLKVIGQINLWGYTELQRICLQFFHMPENGGSKFLCNKASKLSPWQFSSWNGLLCARVVRTVNIFLSD